MKISKLMRTPLWTCRPHDNLHDAVHIMWEKRAGALAVVDDERRVIGMITDRDACMAAYTRGSRLAEIAVEGAMARAVQSVRPDDNAMTALQRMREAGVHRLPVVDEQGRAEGVVSLEDAARSASSARDGNGISHTDVSQTMARLSEQSGDGSQLAA